MPRAVERPRCPDRARSASQISSGIVRAVFQESGPIRTEPLQGGRGPASGAKEQRADEPVSSPPRMGVVWRHPSSFLVDPQTRETNLFCRKRLQIYQLGQFVSPTPRTPPRAPAGNELGPRRVGTAHRRTWLFGGRCPPYATGGRLPQGRTPSEKRGSGCRGRRTESQRATVPVTPAFGQPRTSEDNPRHWGVRLLFPVRPSLWHAAGPSDRVGRAGAAGPVRRRGFEALLRDCGRHSWESSRAISRTLAL
jgi:hypothetical protein